MPSQERLERCLAFGVAIPCPLSLQGHCQVMSGCLQLHVVQHL